MENFALNNQIQDLISTNRKLHLTTNAVLASLLGSLVKNHNTKTITLEIYKEFDNLFPEVSLAERNLYKRINRLKDHGYIEYSNNMLNNTDKEILPLNSDIFDILIETKLIEDFIGTIQQIYSVSRRYKIVYYHFSFMCDIIKPEKSLLAFYNEFVPYEIRSEQFNYILSGSLSQQINLTKNIGIPGFNYIMCNNIRIGKKFLERLKYFKLVHCDGSYCMLTASGWGFLKLIQKYYNFIASFNKLLKIC
ncbi:MAG: hypothetical protein GPJ54_18630 [Candidatus Heimdallarchaeota archaeon]|nr:hypothetical protein [Candidatus Heimdallarchaeota archaeon]